MRFFELASGYNLFRDSCFVVFFFVLNTNYHSAYALSYIRIHENRS